MDTRIRRTHTAHLREERFHSSEKHGALAKAAARTFRQVDPVVSAPTFQPSKSLRASICARWRVYMFATRHLSAEARRRVSRLLKPLACLAASLIAILVLSLPASAALTFTATQIASGDTYSGSMVSGDFDNDGI